MVELNAFDIIGPVMIGPSSSHTAGAVRLGRMARTILAERPVRADIYLHGSFAQTYKGHGTDLALVAGLLGMNTDDEKIKESLDIAKSEGLSVHFSSINLAGAHPNTVQVRLIGEQGHQALVTGSSVGGGSILITEIDGYPVQLTGEYETLLAFHQDRPGVVAGVTMVLAQGGINIARMHVARQQKGAVALMVIETDEKITAPTMAAIKALDEVHKAMVIEPLGR